jgi:hypothetical protein
LEVVEDVVDRLIKGRVNLPMVLPSAPVKRDVAAKYSLVKLFCSMVTTLLSKVEIKSPHLRKKQIKWLQWLSSNNNKLCSCKEPMPRSSMKCLPKKKREKAKTS